MYYLRELGSYLTNSYHIIQFGHRAIRYYYTQALAIALFKIKTYSKTITLTLQGNQLIVPNNFVAILMVCEIFVYGVYKRLHWLEHILDLGGYVGDSAIYLSAHNSKVTMVESDRYHADFAKQNTASIDNIIIHHAAIIASDEPTIYLVWDNEYRGTVKPHKPQNYQGSITKIPALNIATLEQENQFDGIKMDIEWGENEIVRYWIDHDRFMYKKWFIEFHFFANQMQIALQNFQDFLTFLGSQWFLYVLYDNSNQLVDVINFIQDLVLHPYQTQYINIYFEKLSSHA